MGAVFWIALVVTLWGLLPAAVAKKRVPGFWSLATWSVSGVLLARVMIGGADLAGYRDDSLFTLPPLQQAGLVLLAGSLMLLGGWLGYRLARGAAALSGDPLRRVLGLLANLLLTLAGYLAVWLLSPQVFYAYYRLIIPGLPSQWVIGGGEKLSVFAGALRLGGADSLAMGATGGFFWALAALTIAVHATRWRAASTRPSDRRPARR